MRRNPAAFKAFYAALVEQSGGAGDHLAAQEVAALAQGELSGEPQARARAHLLACRDCFAIWRDFRSFEQEALPPLPGSAADLEVARFVRRLRSPRASGGDRGRLRAWGFPLALAASLVAVAALSAQVANLQRAVAVRERTIAELEVPGRARIVDLTADTHLRGAGARRIPEIPAGSGFTAILTPEELVPHPVYRLRIFDPDGMEIHTVESLESNTEDDSFALWIPPGFLSPGEYRLELCGPTAGGSQPLATFRLRIVDG